MKYKQQTTQHMIAPHKKIKCSQTIVIYLLKLKIIPPKSNP